MFMLNSSEYANISKKFGPVKIIHRPKISRDNSTDYQMINHLIHNVIEDYDLIAHKTNFATKKYL